MPAPTLTQVTGGLADLSTPGVIGGTTPNVGNFTSVGFPGSSSGKVTLRSQVSGNTWTMQLPTTTGVLGQVMQTDGTGVCSWVSGAGQFRVVIASGDTSGTTDTAVIQAALNTGPGTVWLTGVNYYVTALTIPSGCTLRGMGPGGLGTGSGGTILNAKSAGAFVCTLGGSYASVQNMTIGGSCSAAISDGGNSALIETLIQHVDIDASGASITNGILIMGASGYYNRIYNCRIVGPSNAAINLVGSNLEADVAFVNIGYTSTHPTYGVYCSQAAAVFTRVETLGMGSYGFYFAGVGGTCDDCVADSSGIAGYFATASVEPEGNWNGAFIADNCWAGSSAGGTPDGQYMVQNINAQLTGCRAVAGAGYGFLMTGTPGSANLTTHIVNGCLAETNAQNGFYYNNNLVSATGNMAIYSYSSAVYGHEYGSGAIGLCVGNGGAFNNAGNTHIAGTMTNAGNM